MKKYLMILPIITLMLTGCGEKKLVCKAEEIDEKVVATFTFKNDEVSKVVFKDTYMADSKEEAEEGKVELDYFMGATYSGKQGVTYDSKVKGKNVVITITMDVSKMSDDTREELLGDVKTYEEIKANAETSGSGYTCK